MPPTSVSSPSFLHYESVCVPSIEITPVNMTFNLPLAHSLHRSSSSSLIPLLFLFVFYHLVSFTLHSGCHALICDHSHISLLPSSRCLYVLGFSHSSHFGPFFSLLTLAFFIHTLILSLSLHSIKKITIIFFLGFLFYTCFSICSFTCHPVSPTPALFFLCLVAFFMFFFSLPLSPTALPYSSLLLNI